jgi:CheY-like chemotaxis protein
VGDRVSNLEGIKKYLETRTTLIVDKSSTIRSSIAQVLVSLGQPKNQILDANRFSDAMEIVNNKKPQIIFTEYYIDTRLGFEFFQKVTMHNCNEKDRLFCMITANTDDYVIAQAAEEDVDAYILKPFSKDVVDKYLQKCIQDKLVASPFHDAVDKAKVEIQNSNFQMAIEILSSAQQKFGETALSFYYLGYCKQRLEQFTEAVADYEKGLKLHPGHYKCLVGKFETLEKLKKNDEAYEVVKYLVAKYPINPDRLGSIIMLAVYTKNFADVDKYFSFYTQLETKTDKVSRIVSAGMYAFAKYLINQKDLAGALPPFRKCVLASNRSVEYLNKIVDTLLTANEPKAAIEFLHMYSMEEQVKPEWRIVQFKTIAMFESPDRIIQKGKALISEGLIHIEIAKKVALLMVDQNKMNHAENFIYSVINHLPDYRSELVGILEKNTKAG